MGQFRNLIFTGTAAVVLFGLMVGLSMWWNSPDEQPPAKSTKKALGTPATKAAKSDTQQTWSTELSQQLDDIEQRESTLEQREAELAQQEQRLLTMMEDIRSERRAMMMFRQQMKPTSVPEGQPGTVKLPLPSEEIPESSSPQ